MPYDLSACGLVTVSTSRFVACALGSHIFGNPNVSDDGTVIIGTVVNGTALSLTDGAAAHTYFKFNAACGSVIQSDSRLTFITTGACNALVLTGGCVGIGTSSPSGYGHGGTNRILEIFNCNTSANAQSHIILTSGATTNPGSFGTITWAGSNYSSANRAGIIAVSTETGATTIPQSSMQFYTSDATSGILERMRITSTGNVGIGETPASSIGWARILTLNGGNVGDTAYILKKTSSAQEIAFGTDGAALYIDVAGNATATNNTIRFRTSNTNSCYSVTERMRITSAGNVGIGTDSPVANDGSSKTLQVGSRLAIQNVIGTQFLLGTNTYYDGTWKYIACARAQAVRGTGESGTIIFVLSPQGTAGCTVTNMDGSDIKMTILESGNTGIGITSPTYRLHVNGTFYAAGSSQDYKQGICNYNTDSCMFMKLKPVTYQYKEEYCHLGKELKSGTQIGLIAEEVAETYPELAILVKENDNDVVRNVDYEKLSVILLSEVQKLRREVDDLKHKQ